LTVLTWLHYFRRWIKLLCSNLVVTNSWDQLNLFVLTGICYNRVG